MGVLRSALAAIALAGYASADCMMYSKEECGNCVYNMTLKGCQSFESPAPGEMDVCLGRTTCMQCMWMENMCMGMGGSGGGGGGGMMMMMQMTFYQSTKATILFDGWTTSSTGGYVGALFLTALFCAAVTIGRYYTLEPSMKLHKGVQIFLYFIVQCGVYMVMLITMTYNAGICLAAMVGITLGWSFWDHRMSTRRALYTEVNTSCH
eukprot:TRINITY_DN75817_c0_g1_i1.p2 TRINITY_DN75817_c0_g1~~TRINITY_DN75817_c0_g1_i1.p2  ORF type:complete len:228 (+),score=80.60 TRINITY_DN75817_c0_g1_i1:64-684(+)